MAIAASRRRFEKQMKTSPRFLLVYPSCNVDVNPTLAYLLESLSQRGVQVDVLLEEAGDFPEPSAFGTGVRQIPVPSAHLSLKGVSASGLPQRIIRKALHPRAHANYRVVSDLAFAPYRRIGRYDAILGVDPSGLATAHRLNRVFRRPLVYLSFEIMFRSEVSLELERVIKAVELEACREVELALIQDHERAEHLELETGVPRKRMVQVPVAPPPQPVLRSDYLRRQLGIPEGRRIVFYFGSVGPWTSRDDFAEMVADWPERYCLVIHSSSRIPTRMSPYLAQLVRQGRVYLSTEPVGRKALTSMVASADIGLAPYKPVADSWVTGQNTYHLGLSSGKVAFYAMCGLPVLARSLPVFDREFARYGCGRVFRRIVETGPLLEEIDRDYATFSREARRFYEERLSPVEGMQRFCDALLAVAESGSARLPAPRAGFLRHPQTAG